MPKRTNAFQNLFHLIYRQRAEGAVVTESKMLVDKVTGKQREVDLVIQSTVAGHAVSVYGHFFADVDRGEVENCLHHAETGLFKDYPHVSGLFFFDDNYARYRFVYLPNHLATRPFALPEGVMNLSYWIP